MMLGSLARRRHAAEPCDSSLRPFSPQVAVLDHNDPVLRSSTLHKSAVNGQFRVFEVKFFGL
jgi:hypothetical protein